MDLDIEDFLPKYGDIKKTKHPTFNPYTDKNFYQSIYFKKEFYDEKLPRIESVPRKPGQQLKSQKIISRFLSSYTPYDEILLDHHMGCLHPDTPVLLYNGGIKQAKYIKVGDDLIGDDGMPRKVLSLINGVSNMYRVDQDKAEPYIVNEDHILTLYISGNRSIVWNESNKSWILEWFDKNTLKFNNTTFCCNETNGLSKDEAYSCMLKYKDGICKNDTIDISIKDYIKLSKTDKNRMKGIKSQEVAWDFKAVKLDPYILGLWLGDDNSTEDRFTSNNDALVEYWNKWATNINSTIKKHGKHGYIINKKEELSPLRSLLKSYDLINNKHIPSEYLINDRQTRLSILAGIIDAEGYVNGTCVEITEKNEVLSNNIQYLCRSLGFYCSIVKRHKSYICNGVSKTFEYNVIIISGTKLHDIPTLLPHKKFQIQHQNINHLVTQINVTQIEQGEYYGWKIDGNRRFLLGDFTITHNSGKTCAAVGAIEQIKNENLGFRGALILAPGKGLLDNFVQEIALKCTPGEYIPEGYSNIRGEKNRMHALRQSVKYFYKFRTYRTFAKDIEALIVRNIPTDDPNREEKMYKNIHDRFSNMIIVMDEVHHLRPKPNAKKEEKATYEMIKLLCRVTNNRKIIIMTGTPMRDSPEEIASIMNLILPEDMPSGMDFVNRYLHEQDDGTFHVKSEMAAKLKSRFRGRVSVLKAMESEVRKQYIGQKVGDLVHSIVDTDQMSVFQSEAYKEAYEKDTKKGDDKRGGGIYSNSRQAELFVYPPKHQGGKGLYGPDGFKEYIETSKKQKIISQDFITGKDIVIYSYSLKNTLRKILKGVNDEQTLNNISMYSSKYAKTLREIVQAQGKCVFIYCEFVTGSGSILFSKLLELLGYTKANGTETSKAKRYALLTNLTASVNEVNKIKNRYNQKDNMNGEYIQVIIGSSIVTEGFSLFNVQEEHILTPYWNYTPIEQALARGMRVGSHQDLIDSGITPVVRIYQHASLPVGFPQVRSIDVMMYKISEMKDISIKQIERLMKESAFDCALVYERNKTIGGIDGSRECDYQDCEYKCDGLSKEDIQRDIPNTELDYSTFQLYYSKDDIRKIIQTLENIFRTNFTIHLVNIIEYFPMYSGFELMSALRTIINRNIEIRNRFGFINYLKEENNVYFLVEGLSDASSYFSSYYTRSPIILTNKTFTELVDEAWKVSIPEMIQTLITADKPTFDMIIRRLPKDIQETYIEASVLARNQKKTENKQLQDNVLRYFNEFIAEVNGIWVSKYLHIKHKGPLRCLIDNTWSNCTEDMEIKINQEKTKMTDKLVNNPYGYYGIHDPENPDYFAIVRTDITTTTDLRKKTTGQNCKSWKKNDIIPLAISLKLDYDQNDKMFRAIKNRNDLEKEALAIGGFSKLYKEGDKYKSLSDDDLKRAFYWGKISTGKACPIIQEWFRERGLLTIGKAGSKKKTDVL